MALKLAKKVGNPIKNPVVHLYRSMIKELPKVLSIYDIDMAEPDARDAVRDQFRRNDSVKDPVVTQRLIQKGYMELEETLMQWKQKSQLMKILEGMKTGSIRKTPGKEGTEDDHFLRHTAN
eukprot:CAMPEP_0194269546 /NCGR_PEP_ID=MMETSP0169-20130528/3686_1 /TAXON_ID=218684 /ORGANISM="Corethron pennatum, Strain L29A3" /LENGTH=120 /DNA_ID=CAMNT_0039011227 /DNA_START=130 /DNA_END=492 /DNA_ORIENTATION=-